MISETSANCAAGEPCSNQQPAEIESNEGEEGILVIHGQAVGFLKLDEVCTLQV
jgi:hypothetical protein